MYYGYEHVLEATTLAIGAHNDQMYGDKPYLYHLTQVENEVIAILGVEAFRERIVAVLHDIIEDTPVKYHDLKERFGAEIADAVWAVTKIPGEEYYVYIDRVRANPLALFIKKCDTMCNLKQSFKEQRHKGIIKYTTQLQLLEAK